MKYGYARVSTIDQDTALQLAALKAAGCKRIVQERQSGAKQRPLLDGLIDQLKPGDELVIYKLDRLARSMKHLLNVIERLEQRGAMLRSITEPINADTAAGRMLIQLLGVFAEFERAIIRERCMAGQLEALKAGKRIGRPHVLSLQDQNEVIQLACCGIPGRDIAAAYGVSKATVYRLRLEAMGRQPREWGQLRQLLWGNKKPRQSRGCYQY